jgi:hypothetical protein
MLRALLSFLVTAIVTAALLAPARAQDDAGFERIEARVTSVRPGQAVIDRGSGDAVAVGDRVLFFTREGGRYEGTVVQVTDDTAVVELSDPSFVPAPGTRGLARIPKSRFEAPVAPATVTEGAPVHPPWQNTDKDWSPSEPLLAKIQPLRPEERPTTVTGRLYTILDYVMSTEDDRSDGFYRVGGDAMWDNVSGHGDRLQVDLEINYRNTDVPDNDDESKGELRFDRLSYSRGGTRFSPSRWEVGRFLQYGMPEFGVLDGFEWGTRTDGGDRFGASLGAMPEPDEDYQSFEDYQIAGYYRWVYDESEELSAAGGYQKTFHNTNADRDLFVFNLNVQPQDGWTFHGTTWIDLYTDSDNAKGPGPEVTQALANLGRRWDSGNSINVIYAHMAFPEMDRDEFLPVTAQQLANDHNDRLAVTGRTPLSDDKRLHAGVGGWVDEDESGGDGELGFDVKDLFLTQSLIDLTGFATRGRFTDTVGARLSFGRYTTFGYWNLEYEWALNHIDGFNANNDDLPQHRVRASREFHGPSGWSLSGHAEAGLWDDETSFAVGIYLQKSF